MTQQDHVYVVRRMRDPGAGVAVMIDGVYWSVDDCINGTWPAAYLESNPLFVTQVKTSLRAVNFWQRDTICITKHNVKGERPDETPEPHPMSLKPTTLSFKPLVAFIEQDDEYICGDCHNLIESDEEFCPSCGAAIDWMDSENADRLMTGDARGGE